MICVFCVCHQVQFRSQVDDIEVLNADEWYEAYEEARKGSWEEFARDRDRFSKRVQEVEEQISWIFGQEHRRHVLSNIMSESHNEIQ